MKNLSNHVSRAMKSRHLATAW